MRALWIYLTVMCSTLILAPSFASGAPSNWRLSGGVRAEAAAEGGLGGGQLGARWRFAESWGLDLVGRTGYLSAYNAEDGDDHAYLGLLAGVSWLMAEGDHWSPALGLRFAHIHHAPLGSWRHTPGANLAGDSNGGVRHRSGAELALSVAGPTLYQSPGWRVRWHLEATGGALPASEMMAWMAGLTIGLTVE